MPVALITGASAGLGTAFAHLCAKDKHDLVLVARRKDKLDALAETLRSTYGVAVHVISADLSLPGAGAALKSAVDALSLRVDVLINNAGFGLYGQFHQQKVEKLTEMVNTNITALLEITHAFVRPMVAQGSGKILQVASTAAFQPGPRMAVYYATKAFVLSLSEALSLELAGTGVTVTALCPGPTATEFMDVANYKTKGFMNAMMMSADEVARKGYSALQNGQRLVVPGVLNKVGTVGVQLAPRGMTLKTVAALTKARE